MINKKKKIDKQNDINLAKELLKISNQKGKNPIIQELKEENKDLEPKVNLGVLQIDSHILAGFKNYLAEVTLARKSVENSYESWEGNKATDIHDRIRSGNLLSSGLMPFENFALALSEFQQTGNMENLNKDAQTRTEFYINQCLFYFKSDYLNFLVDMLRRLLGGIGSASENEYEEFKDDFLFGIRNLIKSFNSFMRDFKNLLWDGFKGFQLSRFRKKYEEMGKILNKMTRDNLLARRLKQSSETETAIDELKTKTETEDLKTKTETENLKTAAKTDELKTKTATEELKTATEDLKTKTKNETDELKIKTETEHLKTKTKFLVKKQLKQILRQKPGFRNFLVC